MQNEKVKVVGIYIRVSTTEQVEGYSLGEQEARLRSYCDAKGWAIYKPYVDGGFSGGNIERPALSNLIRDAVSHKIDTVLVYKLDRLSRSQKDTLFLIEDVFLKNKVDFVSMSENFDTSTPFGKAMIGILSVFAQLEREQIKERMQLGKVARAKDGYFHGGGFIPIGYNYIDGELVINDYEAMQVREVYDLFLKGYPISRIRKSLEDKGYTTKYGNWYSDSSIRSCLTTPIYYGKVTYNGIQYDGKHAPIVDKELYDKVQNRFKELDVHNPNKKGSRKTPFKPTQLLSGLIFCGNCGARYYTHHINARANSSVEGGFNYYSCYSRMKCNKRMITDPNCKNKNWNVKLADTLVIDEILKLQFDEDYINKLIGNNRVDDTNEKIKVLETRLSSVKNQIDKVMDLYQLDSIPFDTVASRLNTLNTERTAIEYEIVDLKEKTKDTNINVNETKKLLKNAKSIIDGDDMDKKRMLIHSLIDRIEFYDDTIKIYWSFCSN